jgi:hypothetical protein
MRDALEDFRLTLESASKRLLSMTEEESEARPAPHKWSPKEIIGHLVDSATNNHQRFVRAQLKDDLIFPGYEQEEWVAVQHYQRASWHALVHLWKLYNLHLAHLIAHIPESKLKQEHREHSLNRIAWKLIDDKETATLEYMILDYIEHMKHHLRQVFGEDA